MSRTVLTTLQVLVAVVTIAIWWIISETSLIGDPARIQFFFSTPADVFWQIVAWFRSGEIWHHLWITLIEAALAPQPGEHVVASSALAG